MPKKPYPKDRYGPVATDELISSLLGISEAAFEIYHAYPFDEVWPHLKPRHHLFMRKAYLAEATSVGVRMMATWAMPMQALMLLRARYEQTVVCSYLRHEETAKGLMPYVRFAHDEAKRKIKKAQSYRHIWPRIELHGPTGFYSTGTDLGEVAFKWTSLSLRDLAKRRDELVRRAGDERFDSLEAEYLTTYDIGSAVIHADPNTVLTELGIFQNPRDKYVLAPHMEWIGLSLIGTGRFDLIQCSDILGYLKKPEPEQFQALHDQLNQLTNQFLARIEPSKSTHGKDGK